MRFVRKWAEKELRVHVQDVSKAGRGYDYEFHFRDGRVEKVEVKGTRKPYGIPDMRTSEFRDKRLKADYMLVVGNVLSLGEERLYKIPREAIKDDNLKPRHTYHIARFQGKKNMEKYLIPWVVSQ